MPRRSLGILALGFAQGLLGWYMVESGLVHRVEVSQYRLVAHLLLALAIYGAILWTALGLAYPSRPFGGGEARPKGCEVVARPLRIGLPHPALSRRQTGRGSAATAGRSDVRYAAVGSISPSWRRAAEAVILLVALTIAAGGFVAGTRAGFVYNTFPLMGGKLVPADYARLHPFVRNWFENVAAVQFDHRVLAMTTTAAVLLLWAAGLRRHLPCSGPRRSSGHCFAAAALQVALGVSTLLLVVPIPLAAAHQAGAVLLLSAAIVFRHTLRHGEVKLCA